MKRSEAAAKLKLILSDKKMDSTWLYQILDAVESIGMLPPLRSNSAYNGWQSEYSGVPSTINEWEPEDDSDNYCGAV